jgi:amidase
MHRLPVKGSGLMEKTATDQTTKRSSKTKRFTIQPPPLTRIYKVPVSGSLFAWEPEKDIRQAGPGEAGFFIEAVQGPMARSVLDCALFLDAMVGFDPRSPISYPAPDTPFQTAVTQANGVLRIAFSIDLNGFSPVDSEMESHLRNALTLIEGGGAVVEETCPNLPSLETNYHTLRGMTWATMARRLPDQISKHFKMTLTENIVLGQSLTMNDIADANLNRTTIYMNMLNLFKYFDVFACPTVGCMPHPAEVEWVREVGGQKLNGYMDWLRFAFLATTAGLPSISVPVGLGPSRLPVGLQLIGPPRGEAKLLAAARAVEVAVGGPLGPIDPIVKRS